MTAACFFIFGHDWIPGTLASTDPASILFGTRFAPE